ncbi:hypothetical protein SAMN05216312_12243 [Cohnella sp. OV330]|uniref:hypothetical protein n=1 Tax=Cohnella sp. OV330 TaxID=1855288 RepID=UPI0008EA5903|nr:hypothetical protein [Cohnella sp. OV330]SFB62699.1 hypothetical protein SAMN05216312_12243 [Cohnella sp. OV330]
MKYEAMAKLKAEMTGNKENEYVQVIGQYLLDRLAKHPDDAEKLNANGKTITGSLEAMRKVAEKKKKGNFAMLTPEQGYAAVLQYFGIEDKPAREEKGLSLSLNDVLGV